LVVLLIAMVVPGAYASERTGVTRVVPSDARGRFGSFGSALVGSAPVSPGPSAVAVDTATDTIYVASGDNINGPTNTNVDTVSVIDGRRCQAVNVSHCKGPWPAIKVGSDPSTVAVDEATDTVYVTNLGDNTVSVINGATCNAQMISGCHQTPATVPVGSFPLGIFADEANHTVYVANNNNGGPGTVSMIDSAICNGSDLSGCPSTPPPTVVVGPGPGDVDVNEVTHTVYVANIVGISAFGENTCNATYQTGCSNVGEAVCTSVDPSCGPFAVAADAANNTIYLADGFAPPAPGMIVSVFDGRTCDASDLAGCATQTPGTVTIAPSAFFEVAIWLVLDARLHSVYAVNQKDDTVSVIDTNVCNGRHLTACATLRPPTVHTGEDPEAIALNPVTQTLYTANQVSNDVSVIDASRCNATNTSGCRQPPPAVPLSGPGALAADPAVSTVYVATGTDTLSMIDSERCNAFRHDGCTLTPPTVNIGARASGIAVDPKTHTVYVADVGSGPTGTVSVFDAATCNATTTSGCDDVQTLQVPGGSAYYVAVDAATNTVYVTTGPTRTVSVFDGASCDATDSSGCTQMPHSVTLGFGAAELGVDTLTDTVYVANFDTEAGKTVSVIDGATCNAADTTGCTNAPQTITLGPAPTSPDGVTIDQLTDTIYVANLESGEGSGTVSVINGATCNAATTAGCGQTPKNVTVGFGPAGIAFDEVNRSVVVANIEDTSISVIDAATCNAIISFGCSRTQPKVAVGRAPFAVAIDPTVGTIYTSNGDNTVSIAPAIPGAWSR
jgi:DNA-binding beta-propeller fold protein YncE